MIFQQAKKIVDSNIELRLNTEVTAEYADGEKTLKADTIIYAVGQKPLREEAILMNFCAPEFHQIGDCVTPRNITSATSEAFMIARNIGRF